MGRRRKVAALAVALALCASLTPQPATAAGGFTIVMGGGNPLDGLGNHNPATYVNADIDGDGDLDVVVREPLADTTIDVLRNDGGSFTLLTGGASPFAGIVFPAHSLNFLNSRVLTGDFDADGDVDLWHHAVTFAAFYRNDGATFSAHVGAADPLSALASRDPGSYVVIDVDGDSDPDVVAREPDSDASLELFRNDAGTFVPSAARLAGISFPPNAANFLNTNVLVLDADRDGDLDLWHQGVGFAALYRNDGTTFSPQSGPTDPLADLAGYAAHTYTTFDADSDGDLDVVVREPTSQMSLDVLRNDPSGFIRLTGASSPFAGVALPTSDFESMYLLVGDYDDDGDADVYNQALNELYVQAGSAPRITARTPAHRGTDVAVTSELTISFDEPVTLGSGSLVLRRSGTGALIERLRTGTDAAQFTGVGTTAVTIRPTTPLPFSTIVTLAIEPGTFVSSTDGDAFAGMAPIAWRFGTAANTPPGVTGIDGDSATFTEGDAQVALDAGIAATVTDADGIGFGGGELTVAISGAVPGEDQLLFGPTAGLGLLTDNGTDVHLAFDAETGAHEVTGFLRSLAYTNHAGDDPTPGARSVVIDISDGDGGSASATIDLTVVAVNDPPQLSAPAGYAVASGSTLTLGDVTVMDPDDDVLHLTAHADIGEFEGGPSTVTASGSTTELDAAITGGAFAWHAPVVSARGSIELIVDDGEAQATARIALEATDTRPRTPSNPSGSVSIDPPPPALLTPAPWEQPITSAALRSFDRADAAPSSGPVADDPSGPEQRVATDGIGTARHIDAAPPGGPAQRVHLVVWGLLIALLAGGVLVVLGRRQPDHDQR